MQELYKKLKGPNNPLVAMATGNIGLSYEMAEDYDQEISYLNQSVSIRLKKTKDLQASVNTVKSIFEKY